MRNIKFQELDSIEKWIGAVAYSNSGSKNTERKYRRDFHNFLSFIGKTADEILADYKALNSWNDFRLFGDKIADYVKAWIIALQKEGLANNTIKNMIGTIQSFFKYNRINLGFIPTAKDHVKYHNRDITKEEIVDILNTSLVRDRAFYSVMAQSGLRPDTICKLKRKHIEYSRLLRGESPVKIDVPADITKGKYHPYFTFISDEAIKYLNSYLKKRIKFTQESYLFVKFGTENEPMRPSSFSAQFNKTIRKLKDNGVLDFEVRDRKPSELRLYTLRKFFKKYTYQVGEEFSEFWMGHKCKGVFDNYRARDPEHHRKLYAEKAMPFLRLENATPTETDKMMVEQDNKIKSLERQVEELTQKDQEIQELRKEMGELKENTAVLQNMINIIEEHDLLKKSNTLEVVAIMLELLAKKEEMSQEPRGDSS